MKYKIFYTDSRGRISMHEDVGYPLTELSRQPRSASRTKDGFKECDINWQNGIRQFLMRLKCTLSINK